DDLDHPGLLEPGDPLADSGLGEAHRPRDRRVRAAAVVLELLDDRLAHVVEQDVGRGGGHALQVSRRPRPNRHESVVKPSTEHGLHRSSAVDASKYVVRRSSILAAEFPRPEAAMSTQTPQSGTAPGTKGLKGGALGLVSSVVIGMASTAPAYSLAASLGLI